jgi:DinB superfamily
MSTEDASGPVIVGTAVVHAPLTRRQAERLEPLDLLADEPVGLLAAWQRIEAMWEATVDRALALGPAKLGQRVNGEWSFVETLRHLVFVADTWIGDVVLEQPSPYDSLGLPPDFVTNGRELGVDIDATPTIDEVLDSRRRSMRLVRDLISRSSTVDLARRCVPREGRFQVVGALQVVIFEEWAHHQYAQRDLALLDSY